MNKYITLLFLFSTSLLLGQNSDTLSKKNQEHFISFNPLNTLLLQQYGLTYEYKYKKLGLIISSAYMNDSEKNFNRVFIAGSTNHGALEFYSGYNLHPQINYYFKDDNYKQKATFCYIGLKGVYKNLSIDSTDFHIWDTNTGGDYFWVWTKHKDDLKIKGAFLIYGVSYRKQHFYLDFNFGPCILNHHHEILLAASQANSGTFVESPPLKKTLIEKHITVTLGINIGLAF